MIKINAKYNPKLLSQFPYDPYYNITIRTKSKELRLDVAYLIIDSKFFEQFVQNNQKIVDLSYLPEQALIRVLKSLYGSELSAESVQQLMEIYTVLDALDIEDYKINIMDQIMDKPSLKNSLQMLQFSAKNGLCFQQFKNYHFDNKLKFLEDNRNYLKLSKLSSKTINSILLQYQQITGQQSHQTINNILENFLNRKAISPSDYFQNPQTTVLKSIWEKFHHSLQYVQKIKSEKVKSSKMFSSVETTNSVNKTSSNDDPKHQYQIQLKEKDLIIGQLQQEKQQLLKLLSRYMDVTNLQLGSTARQTRQGRIQSDNILKLKTKSNQFYKKQFTQLSQHPRTPIQNTKQLPVLNQKILSNQNCKPVRPYEYGQRLRMVYGQKIDVYNSPIKIKSCKNIPSNKQGKNNKPFTDFQQFRTMRKKIADLQPSIA